MWLAWGAAGAGACAGAGAGAALPSPSMGAALRHFVCAWLSSARLDPAKIKRRFPRIPRIGTASAFGRRANSENCLISTASHCWNIDSRTFKGPERSKGRQRGCHCAHTGVQCTYRGRSAPRYPPMRTSREQCASGGAHRDTGMPVPGGGSGDLGLGW